jgi:dTDP-4-amino-4,6-dideoxygalactose transaminase
MRGSLANSEAAQDHCIILPLYPQMSESEQDSVIGELKSAIYA